MGIVNCVENAHRTTMGPEYIICSANYLDFAILRGLFEILRSHFSSVVEFSSKKYSGSTGHRYSFYQ